MEPLGTFKDSSLRGLLAIALHSEGCHSHHPGISGEPTQDPSLRMGGLKVLLVFSSLLL